MPDMRGGGDMAETFFALLSVMALACFLISKDYPIE